MLSKALYFINIYNQEIEMHYWLCKKSKKKIIVFLLSHTFLPLFFYIGKNKTKKSNQEEKQIISRKKVKKYVSNFNM